MIDGIIICLNI